MGGLLEVIDAVNGTHFAAYDGSGNVAGLVKASTGGCAAVYEYGPFGEVIRATGPMARANPFRFSTKFQDDETDLLYYGYRYLNTATGRWLSRDPIEEKGGINLYCFIGNDACDKADYFGLLAMDSVTASIEACLRLPTVPAQIDCLQNLLGTVVSDTGKNLVQNALNTLTSKMKRCASIYASYKVACDAPGCADDGLSMAEYIKRASKASLCACGSPWAKTPMRRIMAAFYARCAKEKRWSKAAAADFLAPGRRPA